MSERVILESRVTFSPQLRGAEQSARWPRLDQAYSRRSKVFVQHSPTKMKWPGASCGDHRLPIFPQQFVAFCRAHP